MRKEKRNRFGIGVLQKIPDEAGEVLCRREQTSLSAGDFSGARRRETPVPSGVFGKKAAETALRFHKSLPEYRETPLISLSHLSGELGVGGIYVKDESCRFGLNAFKGLGGAYAMFRILCRRLGLDPEKADFGTFQETEIRERVSQITFATATDGNHGKGVSWAAKLFGCSARVFMPKGSSPARAQAIRKAGPAEVEITDENYDGAVEMARKKSEEQGWILIQDTSWKGYEEIPLRIIQGYLTMASEAAGQLKSEKKAPTHVFLQAGVGAMAGGVMAYLAEEYRESPPVFCVVEPELCVFVSGAGRWRNLQRGGKSGHDYGRSQLRHTLRGYLADSPGSAGILFLLSRLRVSSRHAALRPSSERRSEDHFRRIRRGDRWPNGSASQRKGADRDQRAAASK